MERRALDVDDLSFHSLCRPTPTFTHQPEQQEKSDTEARFEVKERVFVTLPTRLAAMPITTKIPPSHLHYTISREAAWYENRPHDEVSKLGGLAKVDGSVDESDCIIKCVCGIDDHDGSTGLCEICDTWQHILCYYQSVEEVQYCSVHECVTCAPRPIDRKKRDVYRRRFGLE
jgi:hypothetical protein